MMIDIDGETIWVIIAVLVTALGWLGGRAAYRNGFHDGVLWAIEGEGYPSKPSPRWWGWAELRRRRSRSTGSREESE